MPPELKLILPTVKTPLGDTPSAVEKLTRLECTSAVPPDDVHLNALPGGSKRNSVPLPTMVFPSSDIAFVKRNPAPPGKIKGSTVSFAICSARKGPLFAAPLPETLPEKTDFVPTKVTSVASENVRPAMSLRIGCKVPGRPPENFTALVHPVVPTHTAVLLPATTTCPPALAIPSASLDGVSAPDGR